MAEQKVNYIFLQGVASGADCRLLSMTGLNHAKASMILVVMLDPSMTVRPVKLSVSLTVMPQCSMIS